MKSKNLFIRFVSVLLSIVMIMSIFTILPTSVFAAEKDDAAVSADADVAVVSAEDNVAGVSALEFEEPEEQTFIANSGETITYISCGLKGWNYLNTYFQWYRVTEEGDVAIQCATSDMYEAPIPDTPGETYTFYCMVRRGSESARSYDHRVTRTTEWDGRYMSEPIEDIVLESSVQNQFSFYPNMTNNNWFTEVYRTDGYSYDDPVMVESEYTSGHLTISDDEWQLGESRYYYIYYKATSSLYFRSNIFKVTKPADYDPTPNLNITVGTIFSPVPNNEAPSWRDGESEGIYQYKGAETYAYFFTPYDDIDHPLTDLSVTFYRCDNEDGTGSVSALGTAHADDLSAYPGVNDVAAFENDLKCLLPSDTAGVYYVYAEYSAASDGVSFTKKTKVTPVTVEDVSREDYFRFDASTGTITGYYGCEDTIVYPAEINGVKVKKIRTNELTDNTVNSSQQPFQDVFKTCRKAILPEGLEQIAEYSFLGEKFLEEADVPDSVTRINRNSFYRCARLKSVTVGNSANNGSSRLSYIEGGAFTFSDVLEKLDFSRCGTKISSGLTKNRSPFSYLPALTEFIAPANAQMHLDFRTANYPFNKSAGLKHIANVENISPSGMPNRNYIAVPHIFYMLRDDRETAEYDENYIYYPDEEDEGWTIGGYLRKVVETDGELIFPDTFMDKKITRIGIGDNIDYSYLEFSNNPLRLVIGRYVKEIGAHAFEDAFNHDGILDPAAEVVLPSALTTIGAYAFCASNRCGIGKVNLSDTSVSFIGESAFKNQYFADFGDLVFHGDVTIEDYAFMISDPIWEHDLAYINHDTLLSVTVEGSAVIGYQAFYRHNTLKSVSVSGTLTLDQDAFDKCYYIENVSIGGNDGTFGTVGRGEIIDGKIVDTSRGFSHFRYTPAYPEVTDTQPVEGYTDLNTAHKQEWERTYKRSEDLGYYIDRNEDYGDDAQQGTIAYVFTTSSRINLPGRIGDDEIQIVNFVTLLDVYDPLMEYTLTIGEGVSLLLNTTEYWHPYDVSARRYYLENCCGVSFPSTVKHIPSHFLYNAKLTGDLIIPGTVEQIDSMAFADNEIDTLILHEGVQYIGAGAFTSGAIMWSGNEPDAEEAFSSSSNSTAKYIYNHRDEVGSSVHYSDTSPKDNNVKHIITAEKSNGADINLLPDSLTSIDEFAFADCAITGRLILPTGVRQLGSGAFYSTDITEVLSQSKAITCFGSAKEAYGKNRIGVFEDCKKLKKADFSNTTITTLGKNSFAIIYPEYTYVSGYTTKLQSPLEDLYLPNGLVTVGENALFAVDPGVIHLPDTVTEYYVDYFPVVNDYDTPYTYNGKTLPELSITIPENTTIISRSLFNLGAVTFLNRDQEIKTKRDSYGAVLTENLPTSIPDYCTVRCYKNSFIYNWCVDNNISYELIGGENTLAVRILDPNGSDYISSDLQTIVWRDRTDGIVVDGGRLYCDPLDFDSTHVYECEITFTQEDFNNCDIPRTMRFTFDPSSEDFVTQQVLRLQERTTVTVIGTFGEQAKLGGFSLKFVSESIYGDTVYPAEIAENGSFTAEVPRSSVCLSATVAQNVPFMPLTVKNIAYRDLNEEGKIDLGTLSLAAEKVVPFFRLQTNGESFSPTGTARLISADGSKTAEFPCAFDYIIAYGMDSFAVGEKVRLEVQTADDFAYDYSSDVFTLTGTKTSAYQTVELHTIEKTRIIVRSQSVSTVVALYDESGRLNYTVNTDTHEDAARMVLAGRYTLIAVQSGLMELPDTLQEFRDTYDPSVVPGCVEKAIEIEVGEEYVFEDEVPHFAPVGGVYVNYRIETSMMDSSGAVPLYISYVLSDDYQDSENLVRFKLGRMITLPLVQVNGRYAVFSDGSTAIDESFKGGHSGSSTLASLTLTTAAQSGTICMYAIPDGRSMYLYVNNSIVDSIPLPALNYSMIAPQEITNSPTGELVLSAPANPDNSVRTIRLYVDDDVYSEQTVTNTGKQDIKLPYMLETFADGASAHTLQVEVVDADGETIWLGERYEVIYAESDVPVPLKMEMRLTNENAGVDGVARVEYAALDILTGKYDPMRYILPPWNYNADGTMAKDLTIDYYLTVDRPELVDGDITLFVYCSESSPYIKETTMYYNPETGTYDGQIVFEGGTTTLNDLPYGFDLDIPASVSVSYSESARVKEFEKALSERLNDIELDEEFKAMYECSPDVDEISYVLDNATEFADFTAEEKQQIIDAAIAQNDLNAAYEELCGASEDIFAGFNIDTEGLLSTTDAGDYMDIISTGLNLQTITTVPETLDKTALTGLGYTYHKTSCGVFYTRSDDTGVYVIDATHNTEYRFSAAAETKSALYLTQQASKEIAATGVIPQGEDEVSASLRRAAEAEDDILRSDFATWAEVFYDVLVAIIPSFLDTAVELSKLEASIADSLSKCAISPEVLERIGAVIEYDSVKFNGKTYYVLTESSAGFLEKLAAKKYVQGLAEALEKAKTARQFVTKLAAELSKAKAAFSAAKKWIPFSEQLAKIASSFGGKVLSSAKGIIKVVPIIGGVLSAAASMFDMYISYSDLTEIFSNNEFIKTEMFDPTVKLYNKLLKECNVKDKEQYMSRAKEQMDYFYSCYHKVAKNTRITLAWQLGAELGNFGTSIASCFPAVSNNQAVSEALMIFGVTLTATQILEIGAYYATTKKAVDDVTKYNRRFQQLVADMEQHADCGGGGGGSGGGSNHPTHNPGIEDDDPKEYKPKDNKSPRYPTDPSVSVDPSGYVYEAVASNRIEGATAEIYYKDNSGQAVLWDEAAEHDEINPQTTDIFGEYGWMTPIGSWLVKISKEGYEDADSRNDPAADEDGWLPVPPPQINVNIPLVSKAAPEVTYAAASDKSIVMTFSQYMDIAQLETDPALITVSENGANVPVSFTFTDREESPTQEGVYYGSILHIERTDGLRFSDSVTLSVSKALQNYAGTAFTSAYQQELPVGQIPTEITHSYPNRLVMKLSDDFEVSVRVTDENDAPIEGVTVTMDPLYGDILRSGETTAVTDSDGVARFSVKGIRAGDEVLSFTLPSGVKKTMNVRVKEPGDNAPEKPVANLTDFSVVDSGTELVLTCDTEDATIYYTTDDSCPCQDTESRKEYTGPIKLTESGFYRIAAYTEEGGYSERINLHITVKHILGDVDCSGEVEIRDATWIQRKIADMELPFEFDNKRADVDNDSNITVMDATAIQYYLAQMKTPYPIGVTVS